MSKAPEQSVLDAIDELVDWQIQEGHRRGDGAEEDFDYREPGPLVGAPADSNWRRPITPAPMLQEPTGTWWRCDRPQHLDVEINTEHSLEWRTTGWTITVAGERMVDCVVPRAEASRLCPFRIGAVLDESGMRRPEWFAVRSPQPPREGDWHAWDPAALVPHSRKGLTA